jgi:hypothetical protein
MTLYARQDIQLHMSGATNHRHRRPTKQDGTPVPVWGIDCPSCEAELDGHPGWARSRYKIPLTPDEIEDAETAQAAARQALHMQQLALANQALVAQMTAKNIEPEIPDGDLAISSSSEMDDDDDAATSVEGSSSADYSAMNKNDLKDLARDRGLVLSGTREDLIARHVEHDQKGTE